MRGKNVNNKHVLTSLQPNSKCDYSAMHQSVEEYSHFFMWLFYTIDYIKLYISIAAYIIFKVIILQPGTVAESVEHWSRMWEIVGFQTYSRVKSMTYKIDTCPFLTNCSALLG